MRITILLCCAAVCLSPAADATAPRSDSKKEPTSKTDKPSLEAQLQTARGELAELVAQFTEENPRVKAQRRKIAELEEQVAKQKRGKA
jgi:predicted  nucleic acid-binding Zn-ribbon protein